MPVEGCEYITDMSTTPPGDSRAKQQGAIIPGLEKDQLGWT